MDITETERPADASDALEYDLRRLMWFEQKRLEKLLHEHDLTVPKFLVLINLLHRGAGCPIGDLADTLFQSHATMTGIVDRLEFEGLVTRSRESKEDRRKVTVQLTPKGKELLKQATEAHREQTRHLLAHFPPHDLETFVRLLDSYLDELQKEF